MEVIRSSDISEPLEHDEVGDALVEKHELKVVKEYFSGKKSAGDVIQTCRWMRRATHCLLLLAACRSPPPLLDSSQTWRRFWINGVPLSTKVAINRCIRFRIMAALHSLHANASGATRLTKKGSERTPNDCCVCCCLLTRCRCLAMYSCPSRSTRRRPGRALPRRVRCLD